MFKRVLAAVDGSATSLAGLQAAIDLAGDQDAELFVVHVYMDPVVAAASVDGMYMPAPYADLHLDDGRENGRAVLDKACKLVEANGFAATPVLIENKSRDAAHEIIRQARKIKADVIVLGTHGRRGLRRIVMGSDAEAVVRESPVPVLLVRNVKSARRATARAPATRAPGRKATVGKSTLA